MDCSDDSHFLRVMDIFFYIKDRCSDDSHFLRVMDNIFLYKELDHKFVICLFNISFFATLSQHITYYVIFFNVLLTF